MSDFVAWQFCKYTANIYWELVGNWRYAAFCFKFKPQWNDSNKFRVHWSFTRRWFKADLLLVLMVCIPDEAALLFRSLSCLEMNSPLFRFIDCLHTEKKSCTNAAGDAQGLQQRTFLYLNHVERLKQRCWNSFLGAGTVNLGVGEHWVRHPLHCYHLYHGVLPWTVPSNTVSLNRPSYQWDWPKAFFQIIGLEYVYLEN